MQEEQEAITANVSGKLKAQILIACQKLAHVCGTLCLNADELYKFLWVK